MLKLKFRNTITILFYIKYTARPINTYTSLDKV